MSRSIVVALARLVLLITALGWGVSQASGQMQNGSNGSQTGPYRSKQNVMQMNKTTKAQRMAAAQRTADRKAAAMNKRVAPNSQSGVKQ